jgi:hypothetical protein
MKHPDGWKRLSYLMSTTKEFNATDYKDMVFALLGIVEGSQQLSINYLSSFINLLKEAVRFSITEEKCLEILEGNRKIIDTELPSWLPDGQKRIPLKYSME